MSEQGVMTDEPTAADPGTGVPKLPQATIDDVIVRLRQEVSRDERLLALAPRAELMRLVDTSVRTLWHESRVKAFVPVLAMRRVRESLGSSEEIASEAVSSSS